MIEIDDLTFSYQEGGEKIFSSFSLSVDKGEILLLLSSAGSGKTTLARILTGGAPKYTSGEISGSVRIDGKDLLSLNIVDRRTLVGRVSQDTDEMILFSTVDSEMRYPLENLGLSDDEVDKRIVSTLSLFELEKYRGVSTSELSGGEKKRLMCAVLFAVSPAVMIFDESFDELSPRWREKLRRIIKESGKTVIILASHFLEEYRGLYDRVLSISEKRVGEYIEKPLPSFTFDTIKEEGSLRLENVFLTRQHRSIADKTPFTIDIPSFELEKGEIALLMGDNGSGKSTLSKIACGLLKPEKGHVYIDGKERKESERRVRVAYLMQNPYEQLFLPTVMEELKSTEASDEDIERVLTLFSLDGNGYISELPYGKAKLVQAAVFYLLDRDYAILDELDSALSYDDSINIVRLYHEKKRGLLVITHDEKFAHALKGSCYRLEDGRLCR